MSCGVLVNTNNPSGFSRLVERLNGGDASILDTKQAAVQFDGLSGSITRYLTAGHTWGVGFRHDLGSDMALYGDGGGGATWISIAKLSD